MRITLRHIAEMAGVSRATVSYALKGHPKISKETREKIERIARELNYTPDPALQVLGQMRWEKRQRTARMLLAYLSPPGRSDTGFNRQCLEGAKQAAAKLGYQLMEYSIASAQSPFKAGQYLINRGVQGLIVRRVNHQEEYKNFPWEEFCAVSCGQGYHKLSLDTLLPHHTRHVEILCSELKQRGYQRPALILLEQDVLAEIPDLYLAPSLLIKNRKMFPKGFEFAVTSPDKRHEVWEWLQMVKPDVVIGCTDDIFCWLHEAGFRIPEDMGFVSLERGITPYAKNRFRVGGLNEVSGMDLRPFALGQQAVQLLDQKIRSFEKGLQDYRKSLLIEGIFYPGKTLLG